ncbi:hypothetical protein PFISCL1PPCAC_17026, partial [Pristionchus fissidentatus]
RPNNLPIIDRLTLRECSVILETAFSACDFDADFLLVECYGDRSKLTTYQSDFASISYVKGDEKVDIRRFCNRFVVRLLSVDFKETCDEMFDFYYQVVGMSTFDEMGISLRCSNMR